MIYIIFILKSTKLVPSRRIPTTIDVKFLNMNWAFRVVVGVNSTVDISTQWNHLIQSLDLFLYEIETLVSLIWKPLSARVKIIVSIWSVTNFYFRFEQNENSVNNQNDEGKFLCKKSLLHRNVFHIEFSDVKHTVLVFQNA